VAIYHLSAKIVTRGAGRSVVAAAAYRAGESLDEDATGMTFDYTRKGGVEHTEILAPEGAPDWVHDRSTLWNAVEAGENRKDAQLAREIEVGLPVELNADQQLALIREFVRREFVAKGMIADLAIHRDDPDNPHAHVLLTMRSISASGFGPKERSWNERSKLMGWRQSWEETTNQHLAQAGHDVRIDHRSLKNQGLDLTPGRKIGVGRERQQADVLPDRITERVAEQQRIARENGDQIIADPTRALKAITHHQATFTDHDIAKFLHTRTDGAEQFQAAYVKVTTSPELIALGRDDRGRKRYTSAEMLRVEGQMLQDAERMIQRRAHGVGQSHQRAALSQGALSEEQRAAFAELMGEGDVKALVGVAGSGKSHLLAVAREAWQAEGYTVKGAALAGIAAENLEVASGITSRTLASYEFAWAAGRDELTHRDVLVIDEAGMVGTRQLARVLAVAQAAHAKVVLVGDPEQLQAIEAGAPFRGIIAHSGVAELNEVRRQSQAWQREATRQLATGGTATALAAYEERRGVAQLETRQAARDSILASWVRDGEEKPDARRLILAYTRDDVQQLNQLARDTRRARGELGHAEVIETKRGAREFAAHDRLYFLRNEKSLGVKNGSLGTVEKVSGGVLQVKLDSGQRVAVDSRFYQDLDHGYAATVYKAQGVTVDRSYVLATNHFDRHSTYVALSRHRDEVKVFYGAEDFADRFADGADSTEQVRHRFLNALSRARPKELAHDYLDPERTPAQQSVDNSAAAQQARSREAWMAMRAKGAQSSARDIQAQARERWEAYRGGSEKSPSREADHKSAGETQSRSRNQEDGQSL
jgi:Ti-type conjugative transfer relaxase TraA